MKNFIEKAYSIYIQEYFNILEKIEQENCIWEDCYGRLYHQHVLEMDAIQFHPTVMDCIKDQLVYLLNRVDICLAYKK